jgi:glycosyltransferase involved in cell wall biosynthesis
MAPFQAIATGLPTICTNATACQEFASLSVPLEAEYGSTNQFGIYENGYWADPKLSDLCDRMLYVVRNYSEALDKTWFGSWCIRDNYSWGQVAMKFRERIMELPI